MTRSISLIPLAWLLVSTAVSHAGLSFVPGDLNPGDEYHLAFVTAGTRDGASTDISDYNTFVQSEAERSGATTENYGVSWFAIASTASVDARQNAFVAAPVYLLDGTRIADGFDDMWDSSLDAMFRIDQFSTWRADPNERPWTGSLATGLGRTGAELGASYPGMGNVSWTNHYWILGATAGSNDQQHQVFALSAKLTAPTAVPEPATGVLLLSLAAVLVGIRMYFSRAHAVLQS